MISDDNFGGERDDAYGSIGIQYPPMVCVDYLSHEWKKEDDIWTSWKAMKTMSKKKEFANGVRLENASWRTWAKQKYNLKTVNPEKLNWLKDSDVTWLYGPLHTAWSNHIVSSSKTPTTEDKLNLMPSSTKSCLKKKSIAEILRPVLGDRYGSLLVSSNSDTQLYKRDRDFEVDSDCETSSTCSTMTEPLTPTTGPTKPISSPTERISNSNRKIQFNDHVEQYMVIESDEEDGGIVMKKDCTTITKLEPTKLKEERMHDNEYSSLYTNHGRRKATSSKSSTSSSSNSNTTSSASTSTSTTSSASTSASTSTSTSTSSSPSWANDDDDDDDIGYLDFDTFDPTKISSPFSAQPHSSHNHYSRDIIPPYNVPDEEHFPDDEDDIFDKAVSLVTWVLKARNLSLFS